MSVNQVINMIQALSPDERLQIKQALEDLTEQTASATALQRKLYERGLLTEIKSRIVRPRRPPIEVRGEPVSETIIAERNRK